MNWFFCKLHESIAQNKKAKPANTLEIKRYCLHDLDIRSIMALIYNRILSLFIFSPLILMLPLKCPIVGLKNLMGNNVDSSKSIYEDDYDMDMIMVSR